MDKDVLDYSDWNLEILIVGNFQCIEEKRNILNLFFTHLSASISNLYGCTNRNTNN